MKPVRNEFFCMYSLVDNGWVYDYWDSFDGWPHRQLLLWVRQGFHFLRTVEP